jgi:hypothetical protein
LLGAGELAAARDDRDAAARHLRHALVICNDIGLERYRRRMEHALAQLGASSVAPAASPSS